MKKTIIYFFNVLLLLSVSFSAFSQVNVTATAGTTGPTTYTTLKLAFDAINAGTHQGDIVIGISANTTETAPAVLNSSGAGSAIYTSVLIQPTVDGATISGATVAGRGLIELNGADNVTINGDNPNSSGTNRNLTISNTAANTVAYASAIRIATNTTGASSANNNSILNCNILGSAIGRNSSTTTSTTGSENTTFGIYVGGYGSTTSTGTPVAIASVTTNTTTGSCAANSTTISNNSVSQCARGIVFNGSATTFSTGVTITNNLIGSSTTLSGTPPYTSPATTVYTKGIYISGTTSLTVTGNTIQNMVSYVATPTNAIELNSQIGNGGVTISNNTITGIVCNTTSSAYGIIVSSCASNPVISGNIISGIEAIGTSGTGTIAGISVTHTGISSSITNNLVSNIKQRSTGGYPAYGINIAGGNGHSIINNSISDVNAPLNNFSALTTQYGPFGLRINGGINHKVYHNSINLSGALLAGSTSYSSSSAFLISSSASTGIDVRNNIFSNTLTGAPTGSSITAIMLPSGATSTMNLTINNNAYYQGNGVGAAVAQIGTTSGTGVFLASNFNAGAITPASNLTSYTSTLSASGTNDNASFASSNSAPFVSSTNLHIDLTNAGIAAIFLTGASGTGVANDFDNDIRANTPCMGVDEFTLPICSGTPSFATTTISQNSACGSGNFSMSVSPQNLASGYSYQWQSSSDNITWTNINTATTQNYSANLTSTTYYQCILTCTSSSQSVTSTLLTATINPLPTITITPANNGYFCGGAGQTLTANGASTYSWTPAASLDASSGSVVTSNVSTPTTYTVTGTDANGCINTQQVNVGPPTITLNSTVPNFCGIGGNATLTASSPIDPDLAYTWTVLTASATIGTSSGSTTTATLSETSDFKVTGNGSGAFAGCISEAFISVGVYPLPSAQVTTSANGVCPGTAATINSGLSAGNFSSQSITHAPLIAPPTAVTLVNAGVATPVANISTGLDDAGWGNIPVGFNFNFFGTNYNTISIGTNGTVFFGASPNVGDFTFVTLPSATEPFNMIAVLAMDNDLSGATGGAIKYWTVGYAPNRKFVVSYENVQEYGDTQFSTAQAIFYETTGVIEVHVTSSTNVDRNKLIGVNNGNGTIGVLAYASGTAASATNPISSPFAYRFTPPSNYTTIWTATDANGTTTLASGNNIFSQSVSPLITTTYSISYTNQTTGCTNAPGSAQVVMSVLGNTAPNEIVALTNTPSVCAGSNLNLSTDYTGSTDGLTFQWQVSIDNGISFTNIPNANSLTYTGTQTQTSIYQLQITACGGTPAISSPVSVVMTPYQNCYCTPALSTGCTDGDVIARVILNTLDNNTGTGCPSGVGGNGYSNYTTNPALTTTLLPSSTYNCIVYAGQYDANYAAWIDYNDDGIFDNNTERIGYSTTAVVGSGQVGVLGSSASFPVVLACTPPVGQHRLRIREVYATSGINITPCGSATWGETEDYLITIAPVPTCPAPGQLSVVTTTTTSADLSWNLGCSSASNFDFEYGPAGFTLGTGTLVSNVAATVTSGVGTYTLTGLTPNTPYSIYYRANCGNGDVSPWSVATNGTTTCAPLSLNNPGNQTVCDSYTLPAITEVTPSGNTGLVLQYRTQPNGGGTVITSSSITSSQTVYIYASAGSCTAEQSFVVTVNNSTSGVATVNTCDSYTWINGVTYTSSTNTPTFTLTNAVGCDSVVTLNLTINNTTNSTATVSACESYTWINGITYTSSTSTPTFTLTNAAGCDSIVTLNLTINNSNTGIATISACNSYTWIDGITYTSSTNTPTFVVTNSGGCDSTVTLNLTINTGSIGTDVQTACDSYTWIDGNTYTSSTNSPVFTLTNAVGCDSVVTLNLTIITSSSGTDTQTACDSYTWIDGNTYTSTTSTPTFTLTNAAGCDSTVTLNLTINSTSSSTNQSACGSYSWNGQTYTQSGTYTFTTTNANGCDSIATLVLTINAFPAATATGNGEVLTSSTGSSYQWIDCATNSAIQGATAQSYTASENGSYAVIVTNSSGCSDTSNCVIVETIGTNEISKFNINVNPNPSSGIFNIDFESPLESNLTVLDATGRIIYSVKIADDISLDLSFAVTGVYYLQINSDEFKKIIRVVKN